MGNNFETPEIDVASVTVTNNYGKSGNELPFIPFSNDEDELGFIIF